MKNTYKLGVFFKTLFTKILRRLSENLETVRFLCSHNPVLLNGWFIYKFNTLECRNYGDELNINMLKEFLPKKKLFNMADICEWGRKNKINYIVIGSMIEHSTSKSIIWGAGAIEGGERKLKSSPLDIKAVRGSLTRDYLLKNMIDCPEIYGDPALLIPLVYNQEVPMKHELGIIPHVSEINHPEVNRLQQLGVHVIRFDKYEHWHNVIDEIRSCRNIVSSSLHGLILSDAYSVPNGWIALSDNLLGGHFKFLDYFSSVQRDQLIPLIINENTTKKDLLNYVSKWRPIIFDPLPLIESAPWVLNIDTKNLYSLKVYTKSNVDNCK